MTPLIKIYRNIITGNMFILTPQGFFGINRNNTCNFYEGIVITSLLPKVLVEYEKLLKDNLEIFYYGVYNYETNIVCINKPIILEIDLKASEKFSKKNSYIHLCKEFMLCIKKKGRLYNLPTDITNKIVYFVIGKYLQFL